MSFCLILEKLLHKYILHPVRVSLFCMSTPLKILSPGRSSGFYLKSYRAKVLAGKYFYNWLGIKLKLACSFILF